MIRKLKPIVIIILLFTLILCWGLAIGYTNNIKPNREVINFFFEENEVMPSRLKEFKEIKKDVDIVGWREDSLQTLINPDLNRIADDLKVLSIKGDSSLLLNSVFLFEDDKDGCLINEEAAYKLFGSKNALGKEIQYGERKLTVRGIHKETTANVIIQLLDNEEVNLHGITLDGSKFTLTEINDFKLQSNLKELDISGDIYYTFSKIAVMILPLIILLIIVSKLLINLIKVKRKPILFLIYLIIIFIVIAIFFKVTKVKISIPLDMIPNKWSDFEFWGKLWEDYTKKVEYVIYMKKYGIDIYQIKSFTKTIFYSILSIVIFIINLKLIKIKDLKNLIVLIGILLVNTFIVISTVYWKFGFDINTTMLWLIYPLYFCGEALIVQLDKLKSVNSTIKNKEISLTEI